jgi:hypothetical protein
MTTVSIINPEVTYKENNKIDEEDFGHKSQVYELDMEAGGEEDDPSVNIRKSISVVLGKPKYVYTSKHIIFFPIYAVRRSQIRSQIGVFEVKSTELINIYKQGVVDVTRLSRPLLFSFANSAYLAKLDADPALFNTTPTPSPSAENPIPTVSPILEEEMAEDAKHLALNADKSRLSKTFQSAKSTADEGIFKDIPGFKPEEPLEEETKDSAEKARTEYKESSRNTWMEKYMKNNQYRIHEVESNGDCFFAVIRDAFAGIGKKTDVDTLRAALSAEMTEEAFLRYTKLRLSFVEEIQSLKRDLAAIEKTLKEYKKRTKETSDKTTADTTELIKQSKELNKQKAQITAKITETEELQMDYTGRITNIDTLEKMREHILESSFWADSWSISTLERILNVKFILFSQESYEQSDYDGVLLCSEVSKELQEKQSFSPDYYIMATYSGNHYKLVSYKSRKILQFREVPYDVKILVLNRCLARNSGVYYMIPDFRNLKTKFGIDEDEGAPDDFSESPGAGETYDPNTVFVFYAKSDKSVKPGKGDGERILPENVAKYSALGTKAFTDWRKMLDDEWDKTQLTIDGKKWTSVTHYMQGVRYKKTHPDVYARFSLDNDPNSKLATSVKDAKAFKGLATEMVEPEKEPNPKKPKKPTTNKKVQIIAPDLDFDEKREAEERAVALRSKFLNNTDLRTMLKMTHDALLLHKGKPGDPINPDYELMRVRNSIRD